MRNLKVTLAYDGTNYSGWQTQSGQNHVTTIQEVLEDAVSKIFMEDIKVIGSGRTDAGTHALGQVMNFYTSSPDIPAKRVPAALNSVLPQDIRALNCLEANKKFHARHSAKKKWYRYLIYNDSIPNVFLRDYVYFEGTRIDISRMRYGADFLKGTHDFTAFCASKSSASDYIRRVYSLKIFSKKKIISIDIKADGFLYNMVRIIAGTLLEVGMGRKISPADVGTILEERNRQNSGPTLSAKGLYLVKVFY